MSEIATLGIKEQLDQLALTKWKEKDRKTHKIEDVTGHARERFRASKGAIAQAYNLESEIREASHRGIVAFKNGDIVTADECKMAMDKPWAKMAELDLPQDVFWQHDAQAGQELVEFYGVLWLYAELFGGSKSVMKSAEDLNTTIPSWLAGIADAVTETSKLIRKKLRSKEMSRKERIALRESFITVAEEVVEFLGQFEDCPPQLVNNSRYRGYMNTFRGALSRVETCIERHEDSLLTMLDQDSV